VPECMRISGTEVRARVQVFLFQWQRPGGPVAGLSGPSSDAALPEITISAQTCQAAATSPICRCWYAQSHPRRDFAETVRGVDDAAVEAGAQSLRAPVLGRRGLKKLEYVAELNGPKMPRESRSFHAADARPIR